MKHRWCSFYRQEMQTFLIDFYDENGKVVEGVHDVKYKMIQSLINVYKSTSTDQTADEEITQEQKEEAKRQMLMSKNLI